MTSKPPSQSDQINPHFALGVNAGTGSSKVTARLAGTIDDLNLNVSPTSVKPATARRHMAKALNLALKTDYLETDLDHVYKGARVYKKRVEILHEDYIGLGDGLFARLGKFSKSFALTLQGPDPASPKGKKWIKENGRGSIRGVLHLIGRKLDLLQEFEDKVPTYVEMTLDRLEAKKVICEWNRDEWRISTTLIGLDVILETVKGVE